MSLDPTKDALPFVILARIYTTYPTTFLAVGSESYNDGTHYYEPRLMPSSLGSLREEFPKGFEPRLPLPEMTIEVANGDGYYTSDLEASDYLAGRIVAVYCVERGDAVTSADMIFKGKVDFPGGVEYGADSFKLHVADFRKWWKTKIPDETFSESDYPTYTMPERTIGKPIPVLYGNWYDEDYLESEPWEANKYGVECICIDTGQDADGNQDRNPVFMVGKPVTQLWLIDPAANGVLVIDESKASPSTVTGQTAINISLVDGTFEIDKDAPYTWSESDRFFVKAIGEMDATATHVITNPVEIVRHLIDRFTLSGGADFDLLTYTLAANFYNDGAMSVNAMCRRHLKELVDLWEEVSGLCFEAGIDIYNVAGLIAISVYNPYGASVAGVPDITESDMIRYSDKGFIARIDPDEVYANKITARYYYYTPARSGSDEFKSRESVNRVGVIAENVKRTLEFKWFYKRSIVKWRIERVSFMFGGVVSVYEMRIANRALKWSLTRRITATLAAQNLLLRDMQIRAMDKNLQTGVCTVTAWDVYVRTDAGRWAPAGVEEYITATEDERKKYGYWTDADGLCNPADPASARSKWT